MAKIYNQDNSLRRGKMNKKLNEIHRVRDGKEHVYQVVDEYGGPPSDAQNAHRANFGKINAIVNRIMASPNQAADFKKRMTAANKKFTAQGLEKPYQTLRQYVYAVIREQVEIAPMPPKQLPKGLNLHIRTFADLSAAELYEILKARYAVFTMEQGIVYLDEDDIDYLATHVFITRGSKVIAYARLFREKTETTFDHANLTHVSNDAVFCIGRMLTVERRQGFGARLMASVLAEAKRQGAKTVRLHAQIPAVPFYERFGFHAFGEVFEEADIPHQRMELVL